MTDKATVGAPDATLLHSLCEEARKLAGGLRGSVSRLTLRAGDHAVEIEWAAEPAAAATAAHSVADSGVAPAAEGTAGDLGEDEDGHVITAPLLGTFYRCPEPGAKPFVEEGDIVETGQDVAIVEAMKIMNRVVADRPGRVVKILVEDGEMVEFGQGLVLVGPFDAGS